jgi:hypothetical protein
MQLEIQKYLFDIQTSIDSITCNPQSPPDSYRDRIPNPQSYPDSYRDRNPKSFKEYLS